MVCFNNCKVYFDHDFIHYRANNKVCEDIDGNICDYGYDCADCGPRQITTLCLNDCGRSDPTYYYDRFYYHYDEYPDGVCNDGGEGSEYNGFVSCGLGHDCDDCGPRLINGTY